MADMDSDFRRFLESYKETRNLLEKFDQAKDEDEKNKILAKAHSEYGTKYLGWTKLPIELQEKYKTIGAPQWVLDIANERNSNELRILVEHPEINSRQQFEEEVRREEEIARQEYERMRDNLNVTAAAVAVIAAPIVLAGYSQKAADELAAERLLRDEIFKNIGNRKPTPIELAIILQSQNKTLEIMHNEWKEHLPERYLMHLLHRYNRPNTTEEEKNRLIPQLVDAMQRIHTEGHLDHFDEYLERPLVKAKLKHFDSEKMDELLAVIGQQLYGGNRHSLQTKEPIKAKMMLDKHNLPEDVLSVLQKLKIAHENIKQNTIPEKTRIRVQKVNVK